MLYRELVDIYEKLTSTSSKLEKRDILSDFLLVVPDEIL